MTRIGINGFGRIGRRLTMKNAPKFFEVAKRIIEITSKGKWL